MYTDCVHFIEILYHRTFIDCTVGWGELTVGPATYHTVCRTTKQAWKEEEEGGRRDGGTDKEYCNGGEDAVQGASGQ